MRRNLFGGVVVVVLVALSGACSLYIDPDPPDPDPNPPPATYRLVPRGNVAVLGTVVAVAWDGSQHWIVTRTEVGDYWTPDVLDIFRYDATTGTTSPPIELTDHWERPTGAVWIDGRLWIHYDANSSGLVTSLDPDTGVETPRFSVTVGMNDIDSDGTRLYLAQSNIDATIDVRDLDGSIEDLLWSASFDESLRGLGVVTPPGAGEPEVWGGTLASNRLSILVGDDLVAHADLDGFGSNQPGLLQFAGQDLTFVTSNQLYFFEVVRPGQ